MAFSSSDARQESTTTSTTNNIADSYNRTFNAVNNVSNAGNISLGSTPDALSSMAAQNPSNFIMPMLIAAGVVVALIVFKMFTR